MIKLDPAARKRKVYQARDAATSRYARDITMLRRRPDGSGWYVDIPILAQEVSESDHYRVMLSGGTWLDWQWALFQANEAGVVP